MQIRWETDADMGIIESLYDLTFGQSRTLLSSYQFRNNATPVQDLCFVIEDNSCVIAAIRYWPVCIQNKNGTHFSSLLLGPIAVHPTHQGEGLGQLLICHSLEKADARQWKRIFLVGDAAYYKKFGFQIIPQNIIEFPGNTNPDRCLGKALTPDGLTNITGRLIPCEP